jgi:hypothetical protein
VQVTDDGAFIVVNLTRGPRVLVTFSGDPLPEADRERLVPIRAEGSADEDLLEDSSRAIERYLHDRGYRDADALYTREERDQELVITFEVDRGPRYLVRDVSVTGNTDIPELELRSLVKLEPGGSFVRATLAAGVDAIGSLYRSRGFTRVQVKAVGVLVPKSLGPQPSTDMRIESCRTGRSCAPCSWATALGEPPSEGHEAGLRAGVFRAEIAADRDGSTSVPAAAGSAVEMRTSGRRRRGGYRLPDCRGPQMMIDTSSSWAISASTQDHQRAVAGKSHSVMALIGSRANLIALRLFRRIQISRWRAVNHGATYLSRSRRPHPRCSTSVAASKAGSC